MLTLYSFGKVGMRHFHLQQNHYWRPIINLDKVRSSRQTGRTSGRLETNSEAQLWSLVPAETREAYISGKKKDTAPVINLLNLGYSKLLGSGRIPAIPLVVKTRWVSKLAEQKIKDAGGVVELVA